MNAVIVTFHFLAPHWPSDAALQAHQDLLGRLPGLNGSIALNSRSEIAFLLTYQQQKSLDLYFESDEFRRLSTEPGCNDVFIKEFNVFSTPGDDLILESESAASMESPADALA